MQAHENVCSKDEQLVVKLTSDLGIKSHEKDLATKTVIPQFFLSCARTTCHKRVFPDSKEVCEDKTRISR